MFQGMVAKLKSAVQDDPNEPRDITRKLDGRLIDGEDLGGGRPPDMEGHGASESAVNAKTYGSMEADTLAMSNPLAHVGENFSEYVNA
jgi:hypothetical protein